MRKMNAIAFTVIFLFAIQSTHAQKIFDVVKSGDLQEVKKLISENESLLNSQDENGNTPLMGSIANGKPDIAKYIIEKSSNVNFNNNSGNTPLHLASDRNQIEIVRLLLIKGAEVDAYNKYQLTPLFNAIEKKNVEVASVLIKHGANVNLSSPIFGCPIHRAIYADSPDLLNLLLSNKAKIDVKDLNGKTPLHLSGMLGRLELAKILVDKGAVVNVVDNNGITPLHYAILYGQGRDGKNYSFELAELLVSNSAFVNTISKDGETPLISAARNGYTNILQLLHKKSGDIKKITESNSQTLLHIACIKGYGEMVDYLLAQGINKDIKDSKSKIAGDYALQFGHERIAEKLFESKEILKNSETGSKYLNEKTSNNEAYIWSLNNRGWAIKTKDNLFVFDNEENGKKPDQPSLANGWISAKEICNQNVIALYSAYHAVPNSMEFIHNIENSLSNIIYLHYQGDPWRGGKNSRFLLGREVQRIGTTEIIPYETRDSYNMGSLGYLVKSPAITFFYPNFFPEDTTMFKREIEFLAEQCTGCDFAIIEVVPEMGTIYARYIIEKLKPQMIILYNRSGNVETNIEFKKEIEKKYPSIIIQYTENSGERLSFNKKMW